ncbi:hypothetical protein CKN67_05620 [Carnobacterium divergens]|nr:hypothetical protein CKN67_05620 [Carnobacterium divergens]
MGELKMKKTIIATALLSTVVVSSFAGVASAAEVGTATTKGSVQFKTPGDEEEGKVIKPGEDEEEILPDPDGGGGSSKGALRIQHAPAFKFGIVDNVNGTKKYPAQMEAYTKPNDADPAKKYYMPNFVQVTDERGDITKGWTLSVTGDGFKNGTDELKQTKILLNEQKHTNTVFDFQTPATDLTTILDGFDAKGTAISTDGKTSVEILKTKAGKSTTGSQTSSVFNTSYDKATEYAETDRNAGVELQKGNLDIIEVGKVYESTLTWTLSEAL